MTRGWIKGKPRTPETKALISKTLKGSVNVGRGFLQRVPCDRCGQLMSPANIGKHEPSCKERFRLKKLFKKIMTVQQMKSFRRSIESYGLSVDDYVSLFEKQGGVCAICGNFCNNKNRLSVDHCHTLNKVRGLLCSMCNIGIGHFKNDPEILIKASEYLNNYSKKINMNWEYIGNDKWEEFDTKTILTSYQLCSLWNYIGHKLIGNLAVVENNISNGKFVNAIANVQHIYTFIINGTKEKWIYNIKRPD